MRISILFSLLLLPFIGITLRSQTTQTIPQWQQLMQKPSSTFYEIQKAFNEYEPTHTHEKGDGCKAFRRWENFWESRLLPDGSFPTGKELWNAVVTKREQKRLAEIQKKKIKQKGSKLQTPLANFTLIGPSTVIPTNGGAGRLNSMTFDPQNTNILWVGSPGGGLWKSTNGGASWAVSGSDQLSTLGISAIAIDPTNSSIMYIGTGDRDATDTYGVGLLMSTDGGTTWNSTSLNWSLTNLRTLNVIRINPSNTQVIIASSNIGIHKSTDGGATWTQPLSGVNVKDIELAPNNPNTMYATSYNYSGNTAIYRSTDGGTTWSSVFSNASVNRIAIAVTPHSPNTCFALCSSASGSGYYALYRSTDAGTTWVSRSTTPNVLSNASAGTGTTGQGWYDLALAVNPNDSNDVFVGGVNIWRSTNAGTNWTIKAYWQTGTSVPYAHADQHELIYKPGTTELYACNDGGIFRTSNAGTSWTDLSNGLQIMQFYKISQSITNTGMLIGGAQDNGSNLVNGGWTQVYGGDGMDNAIDQANPSYVYASSQNGNLVRSTNGGTSFSGISPASNGAWVTPMMLDPNNPANIFAAYTSVYRSNNRGTNWTTIGSGFLSGNATFLKIASSNSNYIAVGNSSTLYRTTNGGTNWTNIKGTLPSSISNVAFHPTNPDIIWATISGWTSGSKVYKTTNGGTSWTNESGTLPNVPTNTIIVENSAASGVYLGNDIGVYYKNNTLSDWVLYDDGLPNVSVRDLEIHYGIKKLRVGTFGRGMWQGDLFTEGPVANFTANKTTICVGESITFTDASSNNPTSFLWTINGAVPSISTSSVFTATFSTAGTYNVTLIVTNAQGRDSTTKVNYITVVQPPSTAYTASKTSACSGDSIILTAPVGMASYRWSTNETTQSIVLKTVGSYSITLTTTNSNNCTATSVPQTFDIYNIPNLSINASATTICSGDSAILDAGPGFVSYRWTNGDTNRRISVKQSGTYNVTVKNALGCSGTPQPVTVTVNQRPLATIFENGPLTFCQGDSVILTANVGVNFTYAWSTNATTQNITVRDTGTYYVTVTNPANCSQTSKSVVVNVLPKPTLAVTAIGKLNFCEGDSVVLKATPGLAHYLWNTGDTTSSVVVRTTGTYKVTGYNSAGCSNTTSTISVNVTPIAKANIKIVSGSLSLCKGETAILDAGQGYTAYLWNTNETTQTIKVSAAGTYWAKCFTASCSTQTDSAIVTVQDKLTPVIKTSAIGGNACDSLELDAGPGYAGYAWNTGATTQKTIVYNNGTYYVAVVSPNGCSGESEKLTVTIPQTPPKPVISKSGDTLISTAAARYQWYKDNVVLTGATNQRYIPTDQALYCVRIWSTEGCTNKSDCLSTSDVPAQDVYRFISVQPNPAQDYLNITGEVKHNAIIEISLLDINGRLAMDAITLQTDKSINQRINVQHVARGTYFIRLKISGTADVIQKVVLGE
ncbi:MAG: PKD domain-containing protein [Candidatus Kapaibacterium sp.]